MSTLSIIKKFWFVLVALLLVLLFYFTPLPRYFFQAAGPLNFVGNVFFSWGRSGKNFFSNLKELPGLKNQLALRDNTIAELLGGIAALREMEKENAALKAIIDFNDEKKYILATGKILSYRNLFEHNLARINLGSRKGVAVNYPVVANGNILVGKVTETQDESSLFLPIVDNESLVAISFLEHPEIQAVAAGKLGVSLEASLIPQQADIQIGDTVITSLLESNTPAGLILGRVGSINYQEGDLFKTAGVQPLLSLSELTVVSVIIP